MICPDTLEEIVGTWMLDEATGRFRLAMFATGYEKRNDVPDTDIASSVTQFWSISLTLLEVPSTTNARDVLSWASSAMATPISN